MKEPKNVVRGRLVSNEPNAQDVPRDPDQAMAEAKAMHRAMIDGVLKKHGYKLGKVTPRQGGMLIEYELVDLREGPSVFLTRRLDEIAMSAVRQAQLEEDGVMPRAPEVPGLSLELMVLLLARAREARGL